MQKGHRAEGGQKEGRKDRLSFHPLVHERKGRSAHWHYYLLQQDPADDSLGSEAGGAQKHDHTHGHVLLQGSQADDPATVGRRAQTGRGELGENGDRNLGYKTMKKETRYEQNGKFGGRNSHRKGNWVRKEHGFTKPGRREQDENGNRKWGGGIR